MYYPLESQLGNPIVILNLGNELQVNSAKAKIRKNLSLKIPLELVFHPKLQTIFADL